MTWHEHPLRVTGRATDLYGARPEAYVEADALTQVDLAVFTGANPEPEVEPVAPRRPRRPPVRGEMTLDLDDTVTEPVIHGRFRAGLASYRDTPIEGLQAEFDFRKDDLTLEAIEGELLGGRFGGRAWMTFEEGRLESVDAAPDFHQVDAAACSTCSTSPGRT